MNPAEECWRRLDKALGNRLFGTLDALQEAALTALDDIEPPNIYTYLCLLVSLFLCRIQECPHSKAVDDDFKGCVAEV